MGGEKIDDIHLSVGIKIMTYLDDGVKLELILKVFVLVARVWNTMIKLRLMYQYCVCHKSVSRHKLTLFNLGPARAEFQPDSFARWIMEQNFIKISSDAPTGIHNTEEPGFILRFGGLVGCNPSLLIYLQSIAQPEHNNEK